MEPFKNLHNECTVEINGTEYRLPTYGCSDKKYLSFLQTVSPRYIDEEKLIIQMSPNRWFLCNLETGEAICIIPING